MNKVVNSEIKNVVSIDRELLTKGFLWHGFDCTCSSNKFQRSELIGANNVQETSNSFLLLRHAFKEICN